MMKITENMASGLPCFIIEGIDKSKRTEALVTRFIVSMFDYKMYASETLNNWKDNKLMIRYARNYQELKMVEDAVNTEKKLPANHPERSFLYN